MIKKTSAITIRERAHPSDIMTEQNGTARKSDSQFSSKITIPSCELVIDDNPTSQRIKGCVLEAAFQYDSGYLVFLTEDYPSEEALNIHLLDFSGTPQDSASLSWMYATGHFGNVLIQQPDKISFEFFDLAKYKGSTTWTLQILQKPEFRFPLFSEPLSVWRSFGFKRSFVITETGDSRIPPPIVVLARKIINCCRFKKMTHPKSDSEN